MADEVWIEAAGREVRISNPQKPWFPDDGICKIDVVRHYVAVADGALRGVAGRPMALERYVNGATEPPFYQKRAPTPRPEWIRTVILKFPSGREAEEVVVDDLAQLLWAVNLGAMALHPHLVRATDLDHPDELRIDLDPVPGIEFSQVRDVAMVAREALAEVGLVGWPKTSGSRGIHILVRLEPRWMFVDVRRCALALARRIEQKAPALATSKWWKEERHGVFIDYNQNAKDRTVASAYSVRAKPGAPVSMPIGWDEVPTCAAAGFTVRNAADRYAERGDAHAGIDGHAGELTRLLELAVEFEREFGDAPWPPHYEKQAGEAPRVQPSRKKKAPPEGDAGGSAPKARKPRATGKRVSDKPVIVIAEHADEAPAREGLERWKARHPGVAARLEPHHVLIDKMRGQYRTWTRIRVNLEAVPEGERPAQEALDPDERPDWDVQESVRRWKAGGS